MDSTRADHSYDDDDGDDDGVLVPMDSTRADHPYNQVNMGNDDCQVDDDVQDNNIDPSTDYHHQHVYQQDQKTIYEVYYCPL
jgi:hypothetical protein